MGMGMSSNSAEIAASSPMSLMGSDGNFWDELLGNQTLLESQYDLLQGRWPENYNEVVIVVNKKNEISDVALYSLGLKDQSELSENMNKIMNGESFESEEVSFTYDELLDLKFKLLLNSDRYSYDSETNTWNDISDDEILMKKAVENGIDIDVVGIIRPNDDAAAASVNGSVGYTHDLVEYVINASKESEIAKAQLAVPDTDVFTNLPFNMGEDSEFAEDVDVSEMTSEELAAYQQQAQLKQQQINEYIATLSTEQQQYIASLSEDERAALIEKYMEQSQPETTYEQNLSKLGIADIDNPSAILLYPIDFDAKESIESIIKDYNEGKSDEDQISYTDIVGLMMSSVSTIINMISYVLIAFVSISLVVSSIMIGIITYISVLERTKEIGILRSIGASKKDISRVFNAETLIIGFVSGALGIGLTLLINIPVNMIIAHVAGISNISQLPWAGAVILVLISMCLTLIAGLIPSGVAAKKDPVVALRTE
jgi:putative ABC transport system permease protein